MNYHFSGNSRKEELLAELNKVDNGLLKDNKSLEHLKLEAEFYDDKTKQSKPSRESLADEIMKELISDPSKPHFEVNRFERQQSAHYQSPKRELSPLGYQPIQPQFQRQPQLQRPSQPERKPQMQRENYLVNERELQKNKMQNQKHEGLFPSSSDRNGVRSIGKEVHPEQDKHVSPNTKKHEVIPISPPRNEYRPKFDPTYNPFVPNDAAQKLRKDQRNKQYLKVLEEQRFQHEKKRKERQKEERDIKMDVFESYQPIVKEEVKEKPLIMKKADPNGKAPVAQPIVGNYSQFDKNLVTSKVIELRTKYKKGKIIYQEYERELANFRKIYTGDFDELMEDSGPKKQVASSYEKQESPKTQQEVFSSEREIVNSPKKEYESFPIKNESINYSQFMPSAVQQPQMHPSAPPSVNPSSIPASYLPNQLAGQNYMNANMIPPHLYAMMPPPSSSGTHSTEYVDLLKKMFDFMSKEVRDVRSEQMSQNHVLQETLTKFLTISAQPNLATQNMAPIPNQMQKQFYSDVKQHRQYFQKESNLKKKPIPSNESLSIPFGESDNSQFYDRSLSAIASKVPLNHRMSSREEEKYKPSLLDEFYGKKYKIRDFQKFTVLTDASQPVTDIPSTSSYLRSKNAKEELKMRFEDDLTELKKLQSEKSFKKFVGKMQGNSSYTDRRETKQIQRQVVGSGQIVGSGPSASLISPIAKHEFIEGNPYLKKHASNDDNILTFNQKDLKISSPSGYSPGSKKQILEQDEYQTEPRVRQELKGASSLIQDYENKLANPSKALNFIKMNNQFLSKYENSEESKRDYISIKESVHNESSNKDYFSNNQISPVKTPQNYEESLETIRSELMSVQQSKRPHRLLVEGNAPVEPTASLVEHFESSIENNPSNEIQYSQTVQSVEESSSKFRKPPIAKRRSVGRKKESSLSRSKRPSDQSSLNQASISGSFDPEVPKFDSNLYESEYENSVDVVRPRNVPPELVLNKEHDEQKGEIVFEAPLVITPQVHADFGQYSEVKQPSPKANQSKLKSLAAARKLAQEGRIKFDDSRDYRSVEQKFSQLESFISRKGDESGHAFRQSPSELIREKSKSKEKSPKKVQKRNIMKLLEQLQDVQDGDEEHLYKQEFQSYREESESYQ